MRKLKFSISAFYDTQKAAGKLFGDVDETTAMGKNIAVIYAQGMGI